MLKRQINGINDGLEMHCYNKFFVEVVNKSFGILINFNLFLSNPEKNQNNKSLEALILPSKGLLAIYNNSH